MNSVYKVVSECIINDDTFKHLDFLPDLIGSEIKLVTKKGDHFRDLSHLETKTTITKVEQTVNGKTKSEVERILEYNHLEGLEDINEILQDMLTQFDKPAKCETCNGHGFYKIDNDKIACEVCK